MLFPLSDAVWALFFRGMVFGVLGGFVLILLFFWSSSGKYGALVAGRPIGFVFFLGGLEIGIAVIGMVVLGGLQAKRIYGQKILNRMKNGGAS